jgi:hypothetical protein
VRSCSLHSTALSLTSAAGRGQLDGLSLQARTKLTERPGHDADLTLRSERVRWADDAGRQLIDAPGGGELHAQQVLADLERPVASTGKLQLKVDLADISVALRADKHAAIVAYDLTASARSLQLLQPWLAATGLAERMVLALRSTGTLVFGRGQPTLRAAIQLDAEGLALPALAAQRDPAMNRICSALSFGYPDSMRLWFDHGFASVHLELGGLARWVSISELRGTFTRSRATRESHLAAFVTVQPPG